MTRGEIIGHLDLHEGDQVYAFVKRGNHVTRINAGMQTFELLGLLTIATQEIVGWIADKASLEIEHRRVSVEEGDDEALTDAFGTHGQG